MIVNAMTFNSQYFRNYDEIMCDEIRKIAEDLYTQTIAFYHAEERLGADGTLCQIWEVVPDPCNPASSLAGIPVELLETRGDANLYGESKTRREFEFSQRMTYTGLAQVAFRLPPEVNDRCRVKISDQYGEGCLWEVTSITRQPCTSILYLERFET